MRILYVAHNTDAGSGSNKSLVTLVAGVAKRGHEILVVCPNEKGLYEKLQALSIPCVSCLYGDNAVDINNFHASPLRTLLRFCKSKYYSLKAIPKLLKTCRQFQPDIVHSNTSVTDLGWLLAKKLKCPHVWHLREYGDRDFDLRIPLLKRRIHSNGNYTICVSNDVARHHQVDGLKSNRVIYNGIINEAAPHTYSLGDEAYFLYASRCTEKKGFAELLKAYCAYCNAVEKPVKLVVTDTNSEDKRRMCPEVFADENISRNIRWIGHQKAISELYRQALAVIVPSQSEAFGRVVAEAMAEGCLVVGKNAGGVKEQLDNGVARTGKEIGVRYDTTDDLSRILQAIPTVDDSRYDEMRARAARTVGVLYDADSYCCNVEQFYFDILRCERH